MFGAHNIQDCRLSIILVYEMVVVAPLANYIEKHDVHVMVTCEIKLFQDYFGLSSRRRRMSEIIYFSACKLPEIISKLL